LLELVQAFPRRKAYFLSNQLGWRLHKEIRIMAKNSKNICFKT